MHADEFDVDASLVRRLLAAQFPRWAELPIEPVEPRGTDNALYRLGGDMVVRLPRRERTVATLMKERKWLPRLAPFLTLAVPVPVADGTPTDDFPWPWCVYRWLQGEDATTARIADLRLAAADLAGFVAALQRIDPTGGPPPGEHNFFRGEALAARDAAVRASIDALRDEIDVGAVTAAWEAALAATEWRDPPVWIHGDIDSRNLLVVQGRVSALIDFGSLGVGDPACDVMVAWKVLSAETRDIFRAALAIDDSTWARGRGWALSQALNALSYYTLDTNPVLVRESRRWMAEVMGAHQTGTGNAAA
jgi:aminoglycoside phosphotransferase (APT) family kinase protein